MKLKNGPTRPEGSLHRFQQIALPMIACAAALTGAASGWLTTVPSAAPQAQSIKFESAARMELQQTAEIFVSSDQNQPFFNGRPVRAVRTIQMMQGIG